MAAFEGASARWGRRIMIGVPYLWLLIFFLIPFAVVLKLSFSSAAIAIPPYAPTWDTWEGVQTFFAELNFDNYTFLFEDSLYVNSYLSSLKIASISTFLTLLVGYPLAYAIARSSDTWRNVLVLLVILPFWTSFLIRVYAWIGILKTEGLLNLALESIGLISAPLQIYNTDWAVYIGIVYSYLPFMVLPLYATLVKLDGSLLEASADLGAKPLTTFWRVTFPLSLPGVAAGCFLVFIPAVGEFVIPTLLGGADTLMIGKTLWTEFFSNRDWPLASAVAVLLLLVLVIPIVAFQRIAQREGQS
ncbi:MAG: ABC transporter permease subunit [Pseudomonadota bacterium]